MRNIRASCGDSRKIELRVETAEEIRKTERVEIAERQSFVWREQRSETHSTAGEVTDASCVSLPRRLRLNPGDNEA